MSYDNAIENFLQTIFRNLLNDKFKNMDLAESLKDIEQCSNTVQEKLFVLTIAALHEALSETPSCAQQIFRSLPKCLDGGTLLDDILRRFLLNEILPRFICSSDSWWIPFSSMILAQSQFETLHGSIVEQIDQCLNSRKHLNSRLEKLHIQRLAFLCAEIEPPVRLDGQRRIFETLLEENVVDGGFRLLARFRERCIDEPVTSSVHLLRLCKCNQKLI
ncbi:hypothetical protein ACOME3_000992 [Neoechinorhynchus agilis]